MVITLTLSCNPIKNIKIKINSNSKEYLPINFNLTKVSSLKSFITLMKESKSGVLIPLISITHQVALRPYLCAGEP